MRIAQSGLALITTLIFLAALSVLVLSILELTQLEIRMNQNSIATVREFAALEAALQQLEQTLAEGKPATCDAHCVLTVADFAILYHIEKMPGIVCVAGLYHHLVIGAYYRLTVWHTAENKLPIHLQSTYLAATTEPCDLTKTPNFPVLSAGNLSWREY